MERQSEGLMCPSASGTGAAACFQAWQAQRAPLYDLDPSYLLTKSSLPASPGSIVVGVSWVGVAGTVEKHGKGLASQKGSGLQNIAIGHAFPVPER